MKNATVIIAAFLCGLIFGFGVLISGMANPAKVLSFFDVAGGWDPSLALVMASALAVTFLGYRLVLHRTHPVLTTDYVLPGATDVDGRLLFGAAVFGIGWGLGGLCPGPALSALIDGGQSVATFVFAMLTGVAVAKFVGRSNPPIAASHEQNA